MIVCYNSASFCINIDSTVSSLICIVPKHLALKDDSRKVRPAPFNGDRIFKFRMCEEMKTKNGCKYKQETGKECEYAHSDREWEAWEEKRKQVTAEKSSIRPIRKGCQVELCQKVDCCSADCLEAHGEQEKKAWSAVLGKVFISSHAHAY